MGALLDIDRLAVALPGPRGPLPILHDVSLTVGEGELVGIAGESGCGKSITAQTVLGLLPPGATVTGSARFDGTELLNLDRKGWQRVRGAGIAMVFQDPSAALHPMLTVGRQLTEHMRVHLGVDRKAAKRRAIDLLDQVRLPDPERALDAYPHQFSGGMRQRVAIASALAAQPRLLIADEPTTALDVTVQAGILGLLDRLRRETGLAVAFITHDLGVLSALTARSYVFYAGRVVENGPTGALLTEPRHPYTAALLGARPHGGQSTATLTPIPGGPPAPGELPPGCAFSPRCTHVRDDCRTAVPPLLQAGPARETACVIRPELEAAA
ncbi:ABC transporter ATP-binding protein [Catellatospora sichuanensis]|uniref:ABC transporter ATP-binding protein n=1 Tax=Catellatospora sichuanensis TaxID=1969805 RepID=UPI001183152C|nr:ABC transporter ATP-binding protein [Catellatospora sichuanensis]